MGTRSDARPAVEPTNTRPTDLGAEIRQRRRRLVVFEQRLADPKFAAQHAYLRRSCGAQRAWIERLEAQAADAELIARAWEGVTGVVDVAPLPANARVVDFVSSSASAAPCFPCASYTVAKADSAIGDPPVFVRFAWVSP